ncbi:MAG: hypothetical protein FJ091_03040 [Deltaproteobacteria bacterium]|nr:hypothetical protein [Deltaproteobacteria bacterium]
MTPRIAGVFLAALLATSAFAQAPAATARSVSWLAGCWAHRGGEAGSGETWMPPAGGALLSVARRIESGKLASWEFQRIVERGGSLVFIALPSGQSEGRFPLKSLTAHEVVFERPEDDFPKRVIYRLAQNGNIAARIESSDGKEAIDFPMKRTHCEKARKR